MNKILLAVPTNRGVRPKTAQSLLALVAETKHQIIPLVCQEGYTTAENRAYAVIQAIKNECTHILFIDDDMTFDPDTLEQLLENEKEIVGVWSHSRALPLRPTVAFLDENGNYKPHDSIARFVRPDKTFECYSIGMGIALIDLKVFEAIEKPWFYFESHPSGKMLVGEDAWFCKQARSAGYKIYCDPRIDVGHLGEYEF